MIKSCPHCRLPIRQVGSVYPACHEGVFFVFAICVQCHARLSRLPAGPRYKSISSAFHNVVNDPYRYAHKAFATEIEARVFSGLAADKVTFAGVIDELLS